MNESNLVNATEYLERNRDSQPEAAPEEHPRRIGRYRIEKVLGQGGFGTVYRAHDEQLNRPVAVKVPHARLITEPEDAEAYLAEARTVANLDHPAIVPVYDVGSTENCPCYVVSKFIDGTDLSTRLKLERLAYQDAALVVATVADALHYAHKHGLVHRDVKPGNILIGNDGKPYVVDFGLALREENIGKGPRYAGTPAYMSPEQARGEGHRVDGRSDIFSLGVVLYELLAGRQPFRGDQRAELLEQVTSYDAKPLRQYDEKLPRELERICQKAMAKRASERYSSAHDLAEDLRHFLSEQSDMASGITPGRMASVGPQAHASTLASAPAGSSAVSSAPVTSGSPSDSQPTKIVPKGLRSFDARDADFFLELLPGPRDRAGLPDSVRFWKTRIEETDPDNTFSVGLIYGPSGCGKSSLVKAGLLPRVSKDVITVYIEAATETTEARLLYGLRKRCPALEANLTLKESLAALRRGQGISIGQKVLIVLDQFEQWLHARKDETNTELVQALRQCDGGRVQCIVMVRDDFWLAVSRFLRELEIRLVEGENSALADLFDPNHARKVLAAFGRAFGKLPDNSANTTTDQKDFLKQSVAGLAEEGKVISVRLALFAEMMKGKAWTPATLRKMGGTKGVGVTFLEETFSASTSPPKYRYHQKAARAVLKELLPDTGTDIKGAMRSYAELLEASGYGGRPGDFDDLIRILDSELRLITPTDPEGNDSTDDSVTRTLPGQKYFQLTHDYLVHSLRDWLTRKQKETRRGRAELRLFDTSITWNSKPENRLLPSWWEHVNIRLLTDKKKWTEPQRKMMAKAGRVHGFRFAMVLVVLVILASIGMAVRTQVARRQESTRIEGLVGRLVSAEPSQIPDIVKQLDANPQVASTFLSPLLSRTATTLDEKRARLHARLAMVSRDPSLVDPLAEELLAGKITYVAPILAQLRPAANALIEKFRGILRDEKADIERRFRAALALASYVPESEAASWTQQDLKIVADQLVASNAEFQPILRDALRPIRARLLGNLERIFADAKATDARRLSAANAIADYAAGDFSKLSQLLAVATPEQFAVLYPIVAASPGSAAIDDLARIAATPPPVELGSVERIPYGQRRANAAVTLLRLGEREKVLPVFEMTDDPEALTQFMFRCRPRGVAVDALLDCLERVHTLPNDRYPKNTRYALLLSLGEFSLGDIPESRRRALLEQLADWYRHDPSSGVHGATGWLLRRWGQAEVVRQVDQTALPYAPDREWFTLAITVKPAAPKAKPPKSAESGQSKPDETAKPAAANKSAAPAEKSKREPPALPLPLPPKTFYYTFIVFPAGAYDIGSFDDEPGRQKIEVRHKVSLTRPFALLDREITFEELIAFSPTEYTADMRAFDAKPADGAYAVHWYDAVGLCRWLGQQSGLSERDQAYADPETLDKSKFPREPTPEANWAPRRWPLELDRRGFRLPTEAEWEVASRAGARTAYGYGSDESLLGQFGWFAENSGKHVHPPRELRPSIRGLFDLHGNLFEWNHDLYAAYRVGAVTDPLGAKDGPYRMHRGGGWSASADFCRSAMRHMLAPTIRLSSRGFRLALTPSGARSEKDK